MKKSHRHQTHFSPEKKILEKGKWVCYYLYISYLLPHRYTISRSAYNTILQYLQYSDHKDDNINYKNYLHRGPCTQCGNITHKENMDQSQNHF